MILDGKEYITAKKLLQNGFVSIDIPQYVKKDYNVQLETKPDNVNLFLKPINEHINAINTKFHSVWLDYCGTYGGNEYCRPRADIKTLFQRGLLHKTAIFAVTWTNQHVSSEHEFYNVSNVIEDIRDIIYEVDGKYRLRELYRKSYGLQMEFVLFRVTH